MGVLMVDVVRGGVGGSLLLRFDFIEDGVMFDLVMLLLFSVMKLLKFGFYSIEFGELD